MRANHAWLACSLFVVACGGSESASRDDDGGVPDAGKGLDGAADAGAEVPAVEVGHAGGQANAIAIVGDKAYVGLGPSLVIWDLSDPAEPTVLGATPPFEGLVYGVAVNGTTAYVAESFDLNGRVHIVDVSVATSPVVGGSISLAEGFTAPRNLLIVDDVLFAADMEHGVFALDISDPETPEVVGDLEMPGATGLRLGGDRLYVLGVGFSGTSVLVASADASLENLGEVQLLGATDVAPSPEGILAYVGFESSGVVDASDPTAPEDLLSLPKVFGRTIAASSTRAYIPSEDGMHVIDVSDPEEVREVMVLEAETAQSVVSAVSGDLLVTFTNRTRISSFDVSEADTPVLAGATDVPACSDCIGFAIRGDHAFVSDFITGVRAISLADFATLGRGDIDSSFVGIEDLAVHGDYVYIADWAYGLRIYHVGGSFAFHEVQNVASEGHPSAIEVVGNLLFLGEGTNGGALRVLDVSDPEQPRQLDVEITSKARDLAVQGDYVYVADESLGDLVGGMRIFDVSNPESIRMVAHYDECEYALGVAIVGDRALLACAGDGVHIVDISSPDAPTMLGHWSLLSGQAWAIAGEGDRAYVGLDDSVAVLDVSDPSTPSVVTERATAFAVRAIRVPAPGRIVASAGIGGMYQWQID